MSFISNLEGIPLVTEDTFDDFARQVKADSEHGQGHIPRDYSKEPFGSLPFASALDLPYIDPAEYDERIKDGEREQSFIHHLCDFAGLKVKDQKRTNYCWMNAPIHICEIQQVVSGQPIVPLSPASCAAVITNFANANGNPAGVGGWGTRGVKFLVERGAVPTSHWPDNAVDRRYDTPETNAMRSKHRITEWYDLQPNDFRAMMTCLFHRIPVAGGISRMGHEMTAVAPVKLDGKGRYGVIWDNSYGAAWGKNGRVVMDQASSTANDQVAPRVLVGR